MRCNLDSSKRTPMPLAWLTLVGAGPVVPGRRQARAGLMLLAHDGVIGLLCMGLSRKDPARSSLAYIGLPSKLSMRRVTTLVR